MNLYVTPCDFYRYRQQERISADREEIERQRKVLSKKKPTASGGPSKNAKAAQGGDGFLKPSEKQ